MTQHHAVVPEHGKPLTKYKLKEIYVKEKKDPIAAISHVLGFLVTAVCQKIYLWQLKDKDLQFRPCRTHRLSQIFLLLVADMHKSVSILRFRAFQVMIHLISKINNSSKSYLKFLSCSKNTEHSLLCRETTICWTFWTVNSIHWIHCWRFQFGIFSKFLNI